MSEITYQEFEQEEYIPEGETLGTVIENTPWWLISLFFHGLLFVIATTIIVSTQREDQTTEIKVSLLQKEEEVFDEVLKTPELEETKPINEDETPIEEPIVSEHEISDHVETADDADSATAKGSESAMSDKPFDAKSFSDAIGISGSPGGTFGNRVGGGKRNLRPLGGGADTENAVLAGLIWLKNHQSPDGSWDADNYMAQCDGVTCAGGGTEWTDVGQTGLALLAFLGQGNTNQTGRFRKQVRNGLKYLKRSQTPDGCFGPKENHFMYCHAIAALAMCEAYAMNKSPLLKSSAQSAVDFLVNAQNPGLVWRYSAQCGDNDTSVTGWAVMTLKSAKVAGLRVPNEAFEGVRNWLESVTDESYYRVGYQKKGDSGARMAGLNGKYEVSEAMTAVGMTCRVFMGENPKRTPEILGGAQLLTQNLPEWDDGGNGGASKIDYYYWYYGTLAMFQVDKKFWDVWNVKMKKALLKSQQLKGCEAGSWDPVGAWGGEGGRVYSTALNVLSLEIYYRYAKVFR